MIINNIEKIKNLLEFDKSEVRDTFYFIQVMQRKKDNIHIKKERNNDARTIKHYYVDNMEYFEEKLPEIITLCETFNARAYISLSKKSYEQIAFELLREISGNIFHKNYKQLSHSYSSCCGKHSKEKLWLIDYDCQDLESLELIVNKINKCWSVVFNENTIETTTQNNCEILKTRNVVEIIPTLNGFHIITIPFDIRGISDLIEMKAIEVHKDNPTLLYFNKK